MVSHFRHKILEFNVSSHLMKRYILFILICFNVYFIRACIGNLITSTEFLCIVFLSLKLAFNDESHLVTFTLDRTLIHAICYDRILIKICNITVDVPLDNIEHLCTDKY